MKLWQTRNGAPHPLVEAFTVGKDPLLDQTLLPYDCRASAAHARMLADMGVLTVGERDALVAELGHIAALAAQGAFPIRPSDEDGHTAIESHLTRVLGEAGKKIHAFRSRNDQVTAALRLYYLDRLAEIGCLLEDSRLAFKRFRGRFGDIPLPGFTHTRKAMPSSVGLWIGAFADALADDLTFLETVRTILDQSPLGSGAGYGFFLPLDREGTARDLGFARVQRNALYVQNSRGKFEWMILQALSLVMADLNKLATDLILFTMPEFGYFQLPADCTTGSSIMPHKRNPDPLELLRAGFHRLAGWEAQVRGLGANLISGYHRDFQHTKEPVMEGLNETRRCLEIVGLLFTGLTVQETACRAAMTDELYSAERALRRMLAGTPFRDAYRAEKEEAERHGSDG